MPPTYSHDVNKGWFCKIQADNILSGYACIKNTQTMCYKERSPLLFDSVKNELTFCPISDHYIYLAMHASTLQPHTATFEMLMWVHMCITQLCTLTYMYSVITCSTPVARSYRVQ